MRTTCLHFSARVSISVVAFLTVCGCQSSEPVSRQPRARLQGEPAPTFLVQQVLEPRLLRGPNYQIDPTVPVMDYGYLFKIRTSYGVIPAHGLAMLELRLREMHSIALAERLGRDSHFAQDLRREAINATI